MIAKTLLDVDVSSNTVVFEQGNGRVFLPLEAIVFVWRAGDRWMVSFRGQIELSGDSGTYKPYWD